VQQSRGQEPNAVAALALTLAAPLPLRLASPPLGKSWNHASWEAFLFVWKKRKELESPILQTILNSM
jgi:hypothetical protein